MDKPVIWLVMPVLNEAENLRWIMPQFTAVGLNLQVVVVDNGSTDASADVAHQHGANVVSCSTRGYGAAVQAGTNWAMDQADRDGLREQSVLVIFDADGSSPVSQIEATVRPVIDEAADLVIAQRTTIDQGAMPAHAKFGNWLQVTLLRLATGYRYLDMGPLRALSFVAYERLRMQDKTWGWNIEMQMKAAMLNMKIVQFGIQYHCRQYGKSKISGSLIGSLRAGSRILWSVLAYYPKARRLAAREG